MFRMPLIKAAFAASCFNIGSRPADVLNHDLANQNLANQNLANQNLAMEAV
jgi:hypothetical protein